MKANKILEKPSKVRIALILLYSSLGISLPRLVMKLVTVEDSVDIPGMVIAGFIGLIVFSINLLLFYMIGKGKNWARIAVLIPVIILRAPLAVLLVVGLLSDPRSASFAEIGNITCYVAERILEIIALTFLFQRASSDWFKAMKIGSTQGVSVLGFNPESSARDAGMEKDDVIIEYAGFRGLTVENLPSFVAKANPKLVQAHVVFLRDGHAHSVALPPGPLGISAVDATTHWS
jgi:hypothetical protein